MEINISNLKKTYGNKTAVDISEFKASRGEIIGLLGNNGAGKTTLFRLMLDLTDANEGSVNMTFDTSTDDRPDAILQVNPAKSEEWKKYTGAYMDESFLIDFLTPEEYFDFIGRVCDMTKKQIHERMACFEQFMDNEILGQKKNRIILVRKEAKLPKKQFRSLLNGVLVQERDLDVETPADLKQVTEKAPTATEVEDMLFANKIVKNSKSNAIVLAKNKQLLASGVGQTSRVDALKQAIEKAKSFEFDLNGAVMASDAFFPFPDCVEIADKEGVKAVIQPGGSVKDELTFQYCNEHGVAMVVTGIRHFKH